MQRTARFRLYREGQRRRVVLPLRSWVAIGLRSLVIAANRTTYVSSTYVVVDTNLKPERTGLVRGLKMRWRRSTKSPGPRARPARSRPEKCGQILQPSLVVSLEGLWITQASV